MTKIWKCDICDTRHPTEKEMLECECQDPNSYYAKFARKT
jgi:hypothetical protein